MEMHNAPNRKEEPGQWEQLIQREEQNQPLDELSPNLKEGSDVIKKLELHKDQTV